MVRDRDAPPGARVAEFVGTASWRKSPLPSGHRHDGSTWGTASSGVEQLWSARDARGLAPGSDFAPERRLEAELGYGLPAFGGAFTGTPYAALGLSGSARDWRLGWRLEPAGAGDGFSLDLEGTRRESAGNDAAPEHGIMLRGAMRW